MIVEIQCPFMGSRVSRTADQGRGRCTTVVLPRSMPDLLGIRDVAGLNLPNAF